MSVINTYNLFLSTNKATTYAIQSETNDCTWTLHKPFILTSKSNYFRVRIDSAQIPLAFSQLRTSNGLLRFRIQQSGSDFTNTVQFSNSNPNINQLMVTLISLLTTRISSLYSITLNMTGTYNSQTGRCTFTVGAGLTLTLYESSSIVVSMIGFGSDAVITSAGLVSRRNVNVNPSFAIYIRSATLAQKVNWESIEEKDVVSDILAAIPINTISGTYLIYEGQEAPVTISNQVIDQVNLYLSDNTVTGYSITLNGLDWGIHMVIEEIGVGEKKEISTEEQDLINQKMQLLKKLSAMRKELTPFIDTTTEKVMPPTS